MINNVNKEMDFKQKNKLDPSKKRSKIIAAKVNQEQYMDILSRAKRCSMTMSDYLLTCALGCHPKARLTPSQEEGILNLRNCRSDLVRFFSLLNGCNSSERKELLKDPEMLENWMRLLVDIGNRLDAFLSAVCAPNKVPGNSNNLKSTQYDSKG